MSRSLRFILIASLLAVFHFTARAQQEAQYFGLKINDTLYDKSPRLATGGKAINTVAQYSLKNYTPYVGSQGQCASCVCWASCYAALTTSWAFKAGITDKKVITNSAKSPMFVFVQITNNCTDGSEIDDALKILKAQGDCSIFDYNPRTFNGENRLPEIEPFKPTAYPFRVKDYAAVFPLRADSAKKVDETKLSIVNHQPVIAGFKLYPSFMTLNKSNYVWHPNPGVEKPNAYHAMCVIGYNDYAKTFEVMNSWGVGWGNDGYFEISYQDYANLAFYGYQVTLDDRPVPNDPIKLTGDFELQKFVKMETAGNVEIPIFQSVTPTLVNHQYTLSGADYKKNDGYRLYAKNVTSNCYIYVFSIDPENKAEILYPFSKSSFGQLHNLQANINELPRQYNSSVVEIPGHDNAIVTDVAGNDSMCILYAYNPIDDIVAVVNKIKASAKPDLAAKLKDVLGERLMPENTLRYQTEKMRVSGQSTTGDIIPIILTVTVQ